MSSRSKGNDYSCYVSLLNSSPIILFRVAHRQFKKQFPLSQLQLLVLILCDQRGYLTASELHLIGSGLRASNSYLIRHLVNDGYLLRKQKGNHHGFNSKVIYFLTGKGKELVNQFNAIQDKMNQPSAA